MTSTGFGTHLVVVGAAAVAFLSACSSGQGGPSTTTPAVGPSGSATALPEITPSPRQQVQSALENPGADGLPQPLVDPAEIVSGGPPPDGIPALDHPRFERASEVPWLRDTEPVVAFNVGDDARAYPLQILIWHEIVNDTVSGIPVAVTYCPLCNSAIAFDRRRDATVLDFGTSGRLYRSDLVMYDRQTRSLWAQFIGQAIAGVMTGVQLRAYPAAIVSWAVWRTAHPGGWVLTRQTGYDRDYGTNPYVGYDDVNNYPFRFQGGIDGRLPAMTRVVGVRGGDDSVAVLLDALRSQHVITTDVGSRSIVVLEQNGTSSALDTATIHDGRDVGSTGVFDPTVDGHVLHFEAAPGGFVDAETGSKWTILGVASTGPLTGHALQPIEHVDTFWFVWAAFLPHTRIIGR